MMAIWVVRFTRLDALKKVEVRKISMGLPVEKTFEVAMPKPKNSTTSTTMPWITSLSSRKLVAVSLKKEDRAIAAIRSSRPHITRPELVFPSIHSSL